MSKQKGSSITHAIAIGLIIGSLGSSLGLALGQATFSGYQFLRTYVLKPNYISTNDEKLLRLNGVKLATIQGISQKELNSLLKSMRDAQDENKEAERYNKCMVNLTAREELGESTRLEWCDKNYAEVQAEKRRIIMMRDDHQ